MIMPSNALVDKACTLALIYLYDGRMVGLSSQAAIRRMRVSNARAFSIVNCVSSHTSQQKTRESEYAMRDS